MTGAESQAITTACNGLQEDTNQCQQEGSPIKTIEYSNSLETFPSCESNSTEDSVATKDCIITNAIPSQLEQKRLALRNQRFSLEQRLYEFETHYSVSSICHTSNSVRHVKDMIWKDPKTGMRVFYSGPLNDENEPHGSAGVLKFVDGQIYEGEVCHGMRCGHGINSWPDGQQYCGEWSQNSRNGKGRHSWAVQGGGLKVVTGEWRKGRLHGRISFSWPDGSSFDGMAVNGKRHGRGEHRWSCGKVFRGNYENGKAHGFGTMSYAEGTYRGQWRRGLKEGYGTMLWEKVRYTGEWCKDKPHGQGRVVWQNGSNYTGYFSRGVYDGVGVYVWPSGKKVVARWENGVKETSQYCSWPDGRTYDGEYDSGGNKHGHGKYTWSNGTSYIGAFHRNKRQGQGKLVGSDGEMLYDGLWESDEPLHCSMENILDQLVGAEPSTPDNDEQIEHFFTLRSTVPSENTDPKSTRAYCNDSFRYQDLETKSGKPRTSCASKVSDSFQRDKMGLVEMSNREIPESREIEVDVFPAAWLQR